MSQYLFVLMNSWQNSDSRKMKKFKKTRNKIRISKGMKIHQTFQKNIATMGFVPNQQQNNNKIFRAKELWGLFFSVLNTTLPGLYFFRVANSREEYMYSLFALICAFSIALCHTSLIFKNDAIFDAIEMCENVLIESEFKFLVLFNQNSLNKLKYHNFRFEKSWIKRNVQERQSPCWKIKQINLFYIHEYWCTWIYITKSYYQLLHLIHHRFWLWCLRITTGDVVSDQSDLTVFSSRGKPLLKMNFSTFQSFLIFSVRNMYFV